MPEAAGGVHLAGLDGSYARSHDLRHVRGLVEREGEDGDAKARPVVAEDVLVYQLAEAEVHDQQLEDNRRGPPEPDVEPGEDRGHRVSGHAHDAEDQPQRDAEHHGEYRDFHRLPAAREG